MTIPIRSDQSAKIKLDKSELAIIKIIYLRKHMNK